MTQHDRPPEVDAEPASSAFAARSGQGTLPPPAWAAPAQSQYPPPEHAQSSLVRRSGQRAEEGWLRARVAEARASSDAGAAHAACAALARWLGARDRDLDEAVDLAVGALRSGEDLELRRELAAWLESLGEPARAAAVLKPVAAMPELESSETAYALARTGVLRARAGSAAAAAAAFEAARSIDATDPAPCELLASLWACDADVVSAPAAIEAHLEASHRRFSSKQDDADLADAWRAFAVDAGNPAARALAHTLEQRGRTAAADEVLRAHARAAATEDPGIAVEVHRRRRSAAMAAADPVRAFGAALDEGLAETLDAEDGAAFDVLLLDLGLLDALAARLELRARGAVDASERARLLVQLGRLQAGPLADEARAGSTYEAALAADPTNEDAVASVRSWSRGVPAGEPDESPGARWARASIDGSVQARATALERMAAASAPPLRPIFLARAVERHLEAGDLAAARRSGELATRADLTHARCVAALADLAAAEGLRDRASVAALERAIGVVGPFSGWCFALADALDALGDVDLAAGWSQRCVAQRPGDRGAILLLLDRLRRAGDGSRLRDALAWLLAQPQPVEWAAPPFAAALTELARVDREHASVVARRALDVFGPKNQSLRDAMLGVADAGSDAGFTATVLERWLSSGAEGADRRALVWRLAALRATLGDDEGVARIAARAAREGIHDPDVERWVEPILDRSAGPDTELWALQAKADRLSGGSEVAAAARALRELGAARWDMAGDQVGAVDAWHRAARKVQGGFATLAADLAAFAGTTFALEHLARLSDAEPDDATSAAIATAASDAALASGHARRAFDLAARALAKSPRSSEAIGAAERAAGPAGEHAALSGLYDLAATRAFGRFGRRATHHRAARRFERRGELSLALKHAAHAFHAVPSEGSTFQFLARAAERAGDRPLAVRTVEDVAERETSGASRAAWLLRAASIAGEDEDGVRRKVDVLVRALVAAPRVAIVQALRRAVGAALQFARDDRAALELHVAQATRAVGSALEGPDGARVALALAAMSFELFGDSDGALVSVARAFACDADVDEFAILARHSLALGQAGVAVELLSEMLAFAEQPHAHVGSPALRLVAAIASSTGDEVLRARASIAVAIREPDDDALVVQAEEAIGALASTSQLAFPNLAERLDKQIPRTRRAKALVSVARFRVVSGEHAAAAPLLEKAAEWLDGHARAGVERELRAALDAAGLASEIEARAHRKANDVARSVAARADSWTELAQLREERGDTVGAVAAELEACRLDPDPLERWSALERLAEVAGDDDAQVAALEKIEIRIGNDGRPAALKRLARVQERRGDLRGAEGAWRRVLSLDGEDEEADQAVQAVIATRGDHEELVQHLAQRAERLSRVPDKRELLRAVRLRRAAILEQRLGRTGDACHELELLLAEWPDSVGALRYLADLYDRQSDFARSVELWRRAAALEEAGDAGSEYPTERVSDVGSGPPSSQDDTLRVIERRRARMEAESAEPRRASVHRMPEPELPAHDATDTDDGDPSQVDALMQSAHAAAREGDLSRALARARLAVAAARDRAPPQILASWLASRIGGAGAPAEARQTIEELSRIREPLGRDDSALRAFLLAEALDVVQGGGAGMRELEATRTVVGDHALVALGLAERLAGTGQYAAAIESYRAALAGSLFELRRPGAVALAGAEAAMRAGKAGDAGYFLDVAERHEDARVAAIAQRAKLVAWTASAEPGADLRLYDLEAALQAAKHPHERARARLALAKGRLEIGDVEAAEPLLWEALADGTAEAGDLLAPMLASSSDRTGELVRVRWQQVALEPGDVDRLQSLRAAALANDDRVHARAVEHVLRAFDRGAGPLPPPPLSAQPDQPGILAMLIRPSTDAAGEALALLWEGATQLFVRDPASYGITGVERVLPGPSSPLSRVYDAAMRLLGVARVPLFVPRSASGPLGAHAALLSPPSVILSGDVRQDTTDLRFELGQGIAAALPQNVLRRGLPEADGRIVVDALQTAFGPAELGLQVESRAARLAESFWQIIPASGQRRLQDLLRPARLADYAELVESATQSGRRVGLFLAGDFACAARSLLGESSYGADTPLSLANLRGLCATVPALADLLTLAVRSEYADARWHSAAFASQRRAASSGRFSVF
jgi:tetratricopeptide (TPR) repeat protein